MLTGDYVGGLKAEVVMGLHVGGQKAVVGIGYHVGGGGDKRLCR